MLKKPIVSVIIAAYNEEKRISAVLRALLGHPLIDEVIVVNDGSEDGTLRKIKKFRNIKLISYKKNKGKSYAVSKGISKSRNDLLMLIDADLTGLTKENITNLLSPVLERKADVGMSIIKNGPLIAKILGVDFTSGQRIFSKKIIDNKKIENLSGFGLESYINNIIIKKKLRVKIVNWSNVTQPVKTKKFGLFNGIRNFFKMLIEIINTIGFSGIFYQIFKLKSLETK